MRELKFRVWSECWKKYAFDAELYGDGSLYAIYEDDDGVSHHENTDIVFEFNTGLKDNNGKEVYEGDIVKLYDNKYIVKWSEINFAFIFSSERAYYWLSPSKKEDCQVIGNIHENPELLEEE